MAFEGLSNRLQEITRKMKGKARITESDLKEMLREVKLALLEADVNYKIVKEFIASVQEKALGQDVMKSLKPGEQVVKIVRDELTELLGGTDSKINISPNPPTVIMLVGLQGAGKTTMVGKLANYLRKQGKKPLMVACDVYRPAAVKQLQVVGAQLNIPVYAEEGSKDVVGISKRAMNVAMSKLNDVVIIDTAGRLQIDEALMQELQDVKKAVRPHEILLVVDSMTGQEAVNVAESFNEKVGIDGVNSNLATAIRTLVVLIMAWAMVFLTNKQSGITEIGKKSWIFLILSGLATGASWLCYYKALQMGDASKVVPIDKLSVVITLIMAFVFLHEDFTSKSIIGCILITSGTLFMVI